MVQYSKMQAKYMISKGFFVLNLAPLAKMGSNIQISCRERACLAPVEA